MTLEEYVNWKQEQELKRLEALKNKRKPLGIINYYLPGEHIKVEL